MKNDRDSSSTSFSDNFVDQNFLSKTWQIVTHKSFDVTINTDYVMQAQDADSERTTSKRTRNMNNRQNVELCACRFDIDRSYDCFDMRVRINTCKVLN